MADGISALTAGVAVPLPRPDRQNVAAEGGFGETLERVLEPVTSSAKVANEAIAGMLDGSGDVHDAMIALQKAEMALELTVQIRNKLVQAYQEVMRMPI